MVGFSPRQDLGVLWILIMWKKIIDFTKMKKGGVNIKKLLKRFRIEEGISVLAIERRSEKTYKKF